jgi:hypothetical protein
MSADNRICIIEDASGGWAVWLGSCSEDYYEAPFNAEYFDDKDKAFAYTDQLALDIGYLEGGITIIDENEQRKALKDTIEYALRRLTNLDETGSQYKSLKENNDENNS